MLRTTPGEQVESPTDTVATGLPDPGLETHMDVPSSAALVTVVTVGYRCGRRAYPIPNR